MKANNIHFDIEKVFGQYVRYIKVFNLALINKYKLSDIPYNLSGNEFPKIGDIEIEKPSLNIVGMVEDAPFFGMKLKYIFQLTHLMRIKSF